MAKMFYTIDEAAAKLGKSAGEVRTMIEKGQFSEYRQQGQLVIKASQVDQMVDGDSDESAIPLADSGEIPIAEDPKSGSSGHGSIEGGTKERSGISIFEADELEEADASAQTQVTQSVQGLPTGDPGASGSGQLDITRNDDTSLGAGLLEDVYGKSDSGVAPAIGGGGALFESTGVASDANTGMPAMAMVVAEPYDGMWSGIAGGLALAMTLIAAACTGVVVLSLSGGGLSMLDMLRDNLFAVLGGMAFLVLICAGVGALLGKKS